MIFICYFPFKNSICTIVVFFCIYVLLKVKGMSFLCLGDLKKEKPGRNKVGETDRRMKIRMLMMYLCMVCWWADCLTLI